MPTIKQKKAVKETEILDPQQIAFIEAYLNPESETYGDMKNTAIAVGYSESYAESISGLMPKWLYDSICQDDLLKKAERNLNELLDEKEDKKVKADITKFVASRAGKGKWSEIKKNENTNLNLNLNKEVTKDEEEIAKKANNQLRELYGKKET